MRVAQEETFGPLAPIIRFNDAEQVVREANDTIYGLAAYFYASNLKRVWRVAEALNMAWSVSIPVVCRRKQLLSAVSNNPASAAKVRATAWRIILK